MELPSDSLTLVGLLFSAGALILAIAKAGVTVVQSSTKVSEAVGSLNETVGRIEKRFDDFVANDAAASQMIQVWRGHVDERLDGLEASMRPKRRGKARAN